MSAYMVRRLLGAVPVILGVIAVVFILSTVVPGDPARILMGQRGDPETIELIRHDMGLDRPLWYQFFDFFRRSFMLDLGKSYRNNQYVTEAIAARLPVTARLAIAAMFIGAILGVTFGIISAIRQNTMIDFASMVGALAGVSAPTFWVGVLLILAFCVKLRWLPGTGTGHGEWFYYILPSITLGVRPVALIARLTRSSMLEIIRQDYVRTARAKGLSERIVIFKHALRNAIIPVVTIMGVQVAELLSGVVITETVFALPGLGRLSVQALINRDYPIIRGTVLFMAMTFVIANLLVDLSYPLFDPRIKYD